MEWKQIDKWVRHYLEPIIWPTLIMSGFLLYQHVENVGVAIKKSGVHRKALVTSTFGSQAVCTINLRYRYKDSLYDARGQSAIRYADGDSVLIKFSPQYPSEVEICDRIISD